MNTELSGHRQKSNAEAFELKPNDGKTASPKKLAPILCNLNLPPGCEVTLLASPGLSEDAPIALLLGEGEGPALGGVRTLRVALRACAGREGMLQAARRAFAEAFRRAREHHSKGVYLIGHGIGALFAAKLLADKQLLEECPSSHLLQAVFLISGIYNFNNESVQSLLKTGVSESDSANDEKLNSLPQNINRRPTMITNLVSDHQSFDDRNNLSFICDLSNQCLQFDSTVLSEYKKCKPVHGIQLTPEETIKNSPVFQQVAGFNTKPMKIESISEKCNSLSSSLEEIEIIQMLSDESMDFSPLFDDYKHLQRMAMRVYVFAAEKDGVCISKQSRDIFDCLAEGCDQEDMHFQVKAKMDRRDIRELLKEEDNFLKRLMRYDIVKYLQ